MYYEKEITHNGQKKYMITYLTTLKIKQVEKKKYNSREIIISISINLLKKNLCFY